MLWEFLSGILSLLLIANLGFLFWLIFELKEREK